MKWALHRNGSQMISPTNDKAVIRQIIGHYDRTDPSALDSMCVTSDDEQGTVGVVYKGRDVLLFLRVVDD